MNSSNIVKKIIFLTLMLVTVFSLAGCKQNKVIEKKFPEIVSELKSYKLEATLETFFENGSKECNVLVYYQSPNNYRVELTNNLVKEKQIMIKNDKGVFIILPSINKTFKITSDWPDNTNQPYLLHSISNEIITNKDLISNAENGSTTLEFKTKLFDNTEPVKEKIFFDPKTKLPKDIYIYRSNDSLLNHLTFKTIDTNPKLSNDLFVVDNTITSARLDYIDSPIEFDRSITYPTFCPDNTKLSQEVILGDETNKKAVMKFSGDSSFTLIECYIEESESLKSEYFTGDIYTMANCFALVANNTVKFYSNGIEYTLASNNLLIDELMTIGESLGDSNIK